jgi:predicted Zn-ribbon and HTH transcriptional regulator
MASKRPPVPRERADTLRQAILDELRGAFLTTRDLAARVSLREKEIAPHLEHLMRSVKAKGERLVVDPARCMGCEYAFDDRRSLTKPTRCPACKSERIKAPRFRVEGGS